MGVLTCADFPAACYWGSSFRPRLPSRRCRSVRPTPRSSPPTTSPAAAGPPSAPPLPIGAIGVYTPESPAGTSGTSPVPVAVGTGGISAPTVVRPRATPIVSLLRPQNNDGVWIRYLGEKWVS